MSINIATISGNLTADPQKRGNAENPIINFSVAVNDRRKQGNEWVDVPNYVDCVLFGNRAKSLGDILKKGMHVCVTGKLRYSSWEKDGAKRSKLEIVVDDIVFWDKKGNSEPASAPAQPW